MTCTAKHTKYQPKMPDEWRCPECGVGASVRNDDGRTDDGWVIQDSAGGSEDCGLNHADDNIGCNRCGYGCSGVAFARRLQKAAGMVPCAHCKGSGLVKAATPTAARKTGRRMAIKFEKIQAGMVLYDRHRTRMGNTTMTELGEWPVRILKVEAHGAEVVWNGNSHRPQFYGRRQLERLFDWSMDDEDEAEVTRGSMLGQVLKIRRLPAAERKRRKAAREAAAPAVVRKEGE